MQSDPFPPARTPKERLEEADRLFNWSTDQGVIDQAILEMNEAESDLGYHPTTNETNT